MYLLLPSRSIDGNRLEYLLLSMVQIYIGGAIRGYYLIIFDASMA